MSRHLLALACLPALVLPAHGSCRVAKVVKAAKVVKVKKVVAVAAPVAVFAPIAVQVPAYSAGYAPAVQAPALAPAAQPGADLGEVLKRLSERLDALEKRTTPPADPFNPDGESRAPLTKPGGAVAVLSLRCAGCHDAAVADDKGGGLALTDGGELAELTAGALKRVARAVATGRMPKGGPRLNDAEAAAVVAFADARK